MRRTQRFGARALWLSAMALAACDAASTTGTAPDAGISLDAAPGPMPGVDAGAIEPKGDAAVPTPDATPSADARALDAALPSADARPPTPDAATGPLPDAGLPCESDLDFFARAIAPRIAADAPDAPACKLCHVAEGPAFATRLVFSGADSPPEADHATIAAFVASGPDAAGLLIDKPTARVAHGGGRRFAPGSPDEAAFRGLVARLLDPADGVCAAPDAALPPAPDAALIGDPDAAPAPEPDAGADADAGPGPGCVTDQDFVTQRLGPLVDTADPARPACMLCHVAGGRAGDTRMVYERFADPAAAARNFDMLRRLVVDTPDGARLLIDKPTGAVPHGGGRRFAPQSAAGAVFREVVERLSSPADACDAPPEPGADAGVAPPPEPPPVDVCRLAGPHAAAEPLRRLTDTQYARTISDALGVDVPLADRPPSPARDGFHTLATQNVVSAQTVESFQFAAEGVGAQVDLAQRLVCAPGEADAACVRRFLSATAERLFRRAPTADEAALVTALADTGLPREDAARFGLEVLLQSPQFLYLDPDAADLAPGESRPATAATVAARLSYFLTNAPPDAALRAQAAAGALTTRADVHAAAVARLDAPGVSEMVARFHRDWLHLDQLDRVAKDPVRFPTWASDLMERARTETDLFTTEVVWNGDARFRTLLQDTHAWVDPELAAIYGVPTNGPGFQRVDLGPGRPGVLTRSAFMAAHAYAATSSPVRRGAFVLKQMLCESLSPPPGVNMALPEGPAAAESVRDRLVQHWTDPTCATCHLRIDPIGLAFEHFGAVGEWRDVYPNGEVVDPTGELSDPEIAFGDAGELLRGLADEPRVQACYVRRWYEYAVGRTALPEDACTLSLLARRFTESGGDIRALLADIAATDAFLYVTAAAASPGEGALP